MANSIEASPPATTILPFAAQPNPTDTQVAHLWFGPACATAIMRHWRPGDVARCGLCPREECTALDSDYCLVQVEGFVSAEDAGLKSLAGHVWVAFPRPSGLGIALGP